MAPAVEHRQHSRRELTDRSISPVKTRRSPRGRSSSGREKSPRRKYSPEKNRSPKRTISSRTKSPVIEKDTERVRSPKHARVRSPVRASLSRSPSPGTKRLKLAQAEKGLEKVKGVENVRNSREEQSKGREKEARDKERSSLFQSPSPRSKRLMRAQAEKGSEKVTGEERSKGGEREFREKEKSSTSQSLSPRSKRLMRAQAEKEAEKLKEREHGRNSSREEHDKGRVSCREEANKGRHGERGQARDALGEKRSIRDKSDGGSSRSSRRDRSPSPARRDRSLSPERIHRSRHHSRSPSRVSRAGPHEEASKSRATEHIRDGDIDAIAKMKAAEESLEAKEKEKQKPSFELSGKLAEETNRVRGVTLLFNEPADARKPDTRWRLYVFKAGEVLNEPLYVHRQSCYLFGRERRVADIPTDHPSCSKQHAVIQYRLVEKEQPDGLLSKQVRPYIMDLGSTNGTFINDNRIEPQRYYELFEKDTIRFGNSSREYVILHENSAE